MKPKEGTILTVLKDSVRFADSRVSETSTLGDFFEDLTAEMHRSLQRTPELLDVLKQSGVVDSGGAGLLYIAEGMKNGLDGKQADAPRQQAQTAHKVNIDLFTEDDVLEFGYCTEFLLRLTRAKTDIDAFDLAAFKAYLESIGDSIVCFREGTVIKVHVHTFKPGDVLNYVQQFGEFLTLKIENMTLQHHETMPVASKPHKQYGFVAVAAGEGLKSTFLSLGCDEVVDGGQSMNPSAKDLCAAFENINADTIFVLPNNGNIILTAEQAASLYTGAEIRIIPSRTVGQGYAVLSMLDTNLTPDEIVNEASEVMSSVVTGAVSVASRVADNNGFAIKPGDYLGFSGDEVLAKEATRNEACLALCEAISTDEYGVMMVISGKDATPDDREALKSALASRFPETETYFIDGGQPIFDYMITLM